MHFHHLLPTWKTRFLHHLCTIVTLRVHNGRMECSQPIGVVVNNRQSECSHGGWRLCTRLVACVSGRVSCLHEYAEISVISQWFKTTEQEKTEMQEFLPHRVVKDYGMNRKSVRCRAIKSEQKVYCSKRNLNSIQNAIFYKKNIRQTALFYEKSLFRLRYFARNVLLRLRYSTEVRLKSF